jgi:hypothetical protein
MASVKIEVASILWYRAALMPPGSVEAIERRLKHLELIEKLYEFNA